MPALGGWMAHRTVTVQFSRDGEREGVDLDPARPYRVRIDGGPPSDFVSPWTQEELEQHVETLRNKSDVRPTSELLRGLGKQLGEAIHNIKGIEAALKK